MSVNVPAIFIAILFLHNSYIMWQLNKDYRNLAYFLSQIAPRLSFAILYIWFFLAEVGIISEIDISERGNWVRGGLVYMALVETIGHWIFIEKNRKKT